MPMKLFSLVGPERLGVVKAVRLDFVLWMWGHCLGRSWSSTESRALPRKLDRFSLNRPFMRQGPEQCKSEVPHNIDPLYRQEHGHLLSPSPAELEYRYVETLETMFLTCYEYRGKGQQRDPPVRRVHPLSCQLGLKEAPPGSRIEPRDGLNPKSPGALAIPQTASFRPCSRAARAGDNSGGLTT